MDGWKKVLTYTGAVVLILLMTISLGFLSGIKNSNDDFTNEVKHSSLTDAVKVYRDDFGIPTIIGKHLEDVLFAQGYEFTRDRGLQLEFTRSVANGELMRIFGDDLYESDVFLRTIGLKRSAEKIIPQLDPSLLALIQRYVDGVNYFLDTHENNPPMEFELLSIGKSLILPKRWSVADVISVQGVMAFDLAWGGVGSELQALKMIKKIGMPSFVELFPIENPSVKNYLLSFNESLNKLSTDFLNPVYRVLEENGLKFGTGSNNWVVGPSKSATGKPMISNDPHLSLTSPGIWWKVQMIATEDNFHVDGFALPGTPFITIGHNKDIAWGVTNTGTDAVDLFYMKRNDTHYLVNDTWREITPISQKYEFSNGTTLSNNILMTDFGPLMEMGSNDDKTEYAVKWTLNVGYQRDQILKSLYGMNTATSINDVVAALEYWAVPGQNVVFASTNGSIGYQYTGIIPIRKTGFGVFPHNASTGLYDWIGTEAYEKQYRVIDPAKGYFATSNQRIDDRFTVHVTEDYAVGYRGRRANQVLDNGTNFDADPKAFTTDDLRNLQLDTYTTAADDFLTPFLPLFKSATFSLDANIMSDVVSSLSDWNYRMDSEEVAASIFVAFRQFFVHETFKDELGLEVVNEFNYRGHIMASKLIRTNQSSLWFDDITTEGTIEDASQIAIRALEKAVGYLIAKEGSDISKWEYGQLHQITFEHRMGSALAFLNTGPKPSKGTSFTLNAGGGPTWENAKDGVVSIEYMQNFGPSMRYTAEVEPSWSDVSGIEPVGISGHPFAKHYDDLFDAWIDGTYFDWNFNQKFVEDNFKLSTTYSKGSS